MSGGSASPSASTRHSSTAANTTTPRRAPAFSIAISSKVRSSRSSRISPDSARAARIRLLRSKLSPGPASSLAERRVRSPCARASCCAFASAPHFAYALLAA